MFSRNARQANRISLLRLVETRRALLANIPLFAQVNPLPPDGAGPTRHRRVGRVVFSQSARVTKDGGGVADGLRGGALVALFVILLRDASVLDEEAVLARFAGRGRGFR